MPLLGIDTSAAVSVGIVSGEKVLRNITRDEPRRHAELLAPTISQLLKEVGVKRTELSGVAVGTGPGPYTGLRIGLVTAQTLGYALNIPVLGVPSMDALALAARDAGISGELVTLCDARRGEVYWARYGPEATDPSSGPAVAELADLELGGAAAVGRMAPTAPGDESKRILDPCGADIARLVAQRKAAGRTEFSTQPLYLRRPHVQVPGERKRATPQA